MASTDGDAMESTHGDVQTLKNILDKVDELDLVESVRRMEGLRYYHGVRQEELVMEYDAVEAEIQSALAWAEDPTPEPLKGELQDVGIQQLGAIHAWTGNICYVVTSRLRDPNRTLNSIRPVLYFLKLFFRGLHRLPVRFHYHGSLYRAEYGVSTTWDNKVKIGRFLQFFTPLSFSTDPAVTSNFMAESGDRTIYKIEDGRGYMLSELSMYPQEAEVVTECITKVKVTVANKYDANSLLVQTKQVREGLHEVTACWCRGIELLIGSPIHQGGEVQQAEAAKEADQATDPLSQALDEAGLKHLRRELVNLDPPVETLEELLTMNEESVSDIAADLTRKRPERRRFEDMVRRRKAMAEQAPNAELSPDPLSRALEEVDLRHLRAQLTAQDPPIQTLGELLSMDEEGLKEVSRDLTRKKDERGRFEGMVRRWKATAPRAMGDASFELWARVKVLHPEATVADLQAAAAAAQKRSQLGVLRGPEEEHPIGSVRFLYRGEGNSTPRDELFDELYDKGLYDDAVQGESCDLQKLGAQCVLRTKDALESLPESEPAHFVELVAPLLFDMLKRRQRLSKYEQYLNDEVAPEIEPLKDLSRKEFLVGIIHLLSPLKQSRLGVLLSKTDTPLPFVYGWALAKDKAGVHINFSLLFELLCNGQMPLLVSCGSAFVTGKTSFLGKCFGLDANLRSKAPKHALQKLPSIDVFTDLAQQSPQRKVTIADVHRPDPGQPVYVAGLAALVSTAATVLLHVVDLDFDAQGNPRADLRSLIALLKRYAAASVKTAVLYRDASELEPDKLSRLAQFGQQELPGFVGIWAVPNISDEQTARSQLSAKVLKAPPAGKPGGRKFLEVLEDTAQGDSMPSMRVIYKRFCTVLAELPLERHAALPMGSLEFDARGQRLRFVDEILQECEKYGEEVWKLFPLSHSYSELANLPVDFSKEDKESPTRSPVDDRKRIRTRVETIESLPNIYVSFAALVKQSSGSGDLSGIVELHHGLLKLRESLQRPFHKNLVRAVADRQAKKIKLSAADADHEKTQLREDLSKLSIEITSINDKLAQLELSIDAFWHETLLFGSNESRRAQLASLGLSIEDVIGAYMAWVELGNPIHFLHGSPLKFGLREPGDASAKHDMMAKVLETVQEKYQTKQVKVISVIGMQSSGKSTLLNYVFGCSFVTHVGRCTKGLFISLVPTQDFLFVILDSEGLLSIEKDTEIFDKQIAMMAFGGSHTVLLNSKGEISAEVQKLFQVCLFAMQQLSLADKSRPTLSFVVQQLNDEPSLDVKQKWLESMTNSMEVACKQLSSMNRSDGDSDTQGAKTMQDITLDSLVHVDTTCIELLPFAFKSDVDEIFQRKVTATSDMYAIRALDLRRAILSWVSNCHGATWDGSLAHWFEAVAVLWNALLACGTDLLRFKDMMTIKSAEMLEKYIVKEDQDCTAQVYCTLDRLVMSHSEQLQTKVDAKGIEEESALFKDAVGREVHEVFSSFLGRFDMWKKDAHADEVLSKEKAGSIQTSMNLAKAVILKSWESRVQMKQSQLTLDNLESRLLLMLQNALHAAENRGAHVDEAWLDAQFRQSWEQDILSQGHMRMPSMLESASDVKDFFSYHTRSRSGSFIAKHPTVRWMLNYSSLTYQPDDVPGVLKQLVLRLHASHTDPAEECVIEDAPNLLASRFLESDWQLKDYQIDALAREASLQSVQDCKGIMQHMLVPKRLYSYDVWTGSSGTVSGRDQLYTSRIISLGASFRDHVKRIQDDFYVHLKSRLVTSPCERFFNQVIADRIIESYADWLYEAMWSSSTYQSFATPNVHPFACVWMARVQAAALLHVAWKFKLKVCQRAFEDLSKERDSVLTKMKLKLKIGNAVVEAAKLSAKNVADALWNALVVEAVDAVQKGVKKVDTDTAEKLRDDLWNQFFNPNRPNYRLFLQYISNPRGTMHMRFASIFKTKLSLSMCGPIRGAFDRYRQAVANTTRKLQTYVDNVDKGQSFTKQGLIDAIEQGMASPGLCDQARATVDVPGAEVMSSWEGVEIFARTFTRTFTDLTTSRSSDEGRDELMQVVDSAASEHFLGMWAQVRGCTQTCPCCFAPCKHVDPNHVQNAGTGHACVKHFLMGFGGTFLGTYTSPSPHHCCTPAIWGSTWIFGKDEYDNRWDFLTARYAEWTLNGDWRLDDKAELEEAQVEQEKAWVCLEDVLHLVHPNFDRAKIKGLFADRHSLWRQTVGPLDLKTAEELLKQVSNFSASSLVDKSEIFGD